MTSALSTRFRSSLQRAATRLKLPSGRFSSDLKSSNPLPDTPSPLSATCQGLGYAANVALPSTDQSDQLLPPELLSHIFHLVFEDINLATRKAAIRRSLRLVNRYWNQVVLDTPMLWTTLLIHPTFPLGPHTQELAAHGVPIDVVVDIDAFVRKLALSKTADKIQSDIRRISGDLAGYPPPWRSLTINHDLDAVDALPVFEEIRDIFAGADNPGLEVLNIRTSSLGTSPDLSGTPMGELARVMANWPAAGTLRLYGPRLDLRALDLSKLTRLEIGASSRKGTPPNEIVPSSWEVIAANAPCLAHFVIYNTTFNLGTFFTVPILFPRLRTLHLSFWHNSGRVFQRVIELFQVSLLEDLAIINVSLSNIFVTFNSMSRSVEGRKPLFPRLRVLTLSSRGIDDSVGVVLPYVRVLRTMAPDLNELRISLEDPHVVRSLMDTLHPGGHAMPIWPHLRTLALGVEGDTNRHGFWYSGAILPALERRARQASPGITRLLIDERWRDGLDQRIRDWCSNHSVSIGNWHHCDSGVDWEFGDADW
jgi:hypothetical protein